MAISRSWYIMHRRNLSIVLLPRFVKFGSVEPKTADECVTHRRASAESMSEPTDAAVDRVLATGDRASVCGLSGRIDLNELIVTLEEWKDGRWSATLDVSGEGVRIKPMNL